MVTGFLLNIKSELCSPKPQVPNILHEELSCQPMESWFKLFLQNLKTCLPLKSHWNLILSQSLTKCLPAKGLEHSLNIQLFVGFYEDCSNYTSGVKLHLWGHDWSCPRGAMIYIEMYMDIHKIFSTKATSHRAQIFAMWHLQ